VNYPQPAWCSDADRSSFHARLPDIAAGNSATAGAEKGYKLTIDGTVVNIDLGEVQDVQLKDGRKVSVQIERNDTVTFSGATFSFDHDGQFNVAKTDLGNGVTQYALFTPLGTMIIVQEYSDLNPVSVTDFMLQQILRDEQSAGAKLVKQPAERSLADGRMLKGVKAETTDQFDITDAEVVAAGSPNGGIIVVTRIDKHYIAKDGAILDKLWSTLKYKG
jgi:hypothetical protein